LVHPFTLVTLSGPLVGAIGYFFDLPVVFWIGVALAGFNLFMNLASGAMKGAPLPMLVAAIFAVFIAPWYVGAAVGFLVYTAVEGLFELLPRQSWRGSNSN
jgi:hypothetical protein